MDAMQFTLMCWSFIVGFVTIFYCAVGLWVINRFKTSEEFRAYCIAWRDKPQFDIVAWLCMALLALVIIFSREEKE